MKVIKRLKSKYIESKGYTEVDNFEVKDFYDACDRIKNHFKFMKQGDDKWRLAEQDFDGNSFYFTDGYLIYWFEIVN